MATPQEVYGEHVDMVLDSSNIGVEEVADHPVVGINTRAR